MLSVNEVNLEPTFCPHPCRNPGFLQRQASLINNLDGVSAFSQTNNFIQRAEWILSRAYFHYVKTKKKLCSPFILSPQRHLFKLLALLDVKKCSCQAPHSELLFPTLLARAHNPSDPCRAEGGLILSLPRSTARMGLWHGEPQQAHGGRASTTTRTMLQEQAHSFAACHRHEQEDCFAEVSLQHAHG